MISSACSHSESLYSGQLQVTYQLVRDKHKAGVLLRICLFSNEAEESLLSLVVSAVGYPEETFTVTFQLSLVVVTCVAGTGAEFF